MENELEDDSDYRLENRMEHRLEGTRWWFERCVGGVAGGSLEVGLEDRLSEDVLEENGLEAGIDKHIFLRIDESIFRRIDWKTD